MNTRSERIDYVTYCAYCGKILEDNRYGVCSATNLPVICDCENAKEELSTYNKIKELYNEPLAENVIEAKVNAYRDKLLGIPKKIYFAI